MEKLMKVSIEVPTIGIVEFYADLNDFVIENDGIGSYEYWGAKYCDRGDDYLHLEEVFWNKELFSEEQNISILDYLGETSTREDCVYQKLCDLTSEVWGEWRDEMEEASF